MMCLQLTNYKQNLPRRWTIVNYQECTCVKGIFWTSYKWIDKTSQREHAKRLNASMNFGFDNVLNAYKEGYKKLSKHERDIMNGGS